MKLEFEYGNGMMAAELPDTTDVFIPGETVKDSPRLPQDWDSLYYFLFVRLLSSSPAFPEKP